MNGPIDIVLPWVDGNDPMWQAEKKKYQQELNTDCDANSEIRYQSWDNLHYWFRAVEKFLPWVNNIYLITCGHVPEFLNTEHPKLKLVKHSEYIPEEFLPTFNSNTIEMNVHRIEGLSENYILFNDDTIPLMHIDEEYYFKNNKVCDEAVESPIMPVDIGDISRWSCTMKANNILFINRHFRKREVQKKNFFKWYSIKYGQLLRRNIGLHYWYNFVGFHDPHMANPMKKSTLKKLWDLEPDTLRTASLNKFRGETDVSQYLMRYWQLCEGDFYPKRVKGKSFTINGNTYKGVAEGIRKQKWQMVSLNESGTDDNFELIKATINEAFEEILPEKSSFEK